jgi:hypothetical protein
MSEDNWLLKSVEPKSDQLNADDLVGGPVTVRVKDVKRGKTPEQPVWLELDGYDGRPYKPCKSMRRVLIQLWGDSPAKWAGRSMTLFCDPSVSFGGMRVGGIRISHLSDIEHEVTLLLTTTRGKRGECKIAPLVVKSSESMLDRALKAVAVADDLEKLSAIESRSKEVWPDATFPDAKTLAAAIKAKAQELSQ